MAVYLPLKACRSSRYRVIRLIQDSAEGRSGMPRSSAKPSEIIICKDEAVGRIMQEEEEEKEEEGGGGASTIQPNAKHAEYSKHEAACLQTDGICFSHQWR